MNYKIKKPKKTGSQSKPVTAGPCTLLVSYHHDERREVHPTYVPKEIRSEAEHLVNTLAKSIGSEKPRNGYSLEETYPKQRYSRSRVCIHQLKYIHSALKSTHISA